MVYGECEADQIFPLVRICAFDAGQNRKLGASGLLNHDQRIFVTSDETVTL